MYIRDFVVKGRGAFPIDMLRYDMCYPARQVDIEAINAEEVERTVTLRRPSAQKHGGWPTIARWESFGWTVIHKSETSMKIQFT